MLNRVWIRSWGFMALMVGAMLLAGGLILPPEGRADGGKGFSSHHGQRGHKDFVGHALRRLLHDQKDLNMSEEQVGKIKAISLDYAKTRIRDKAEVKLAQVDVRALVFDEKAEISSIEAAMRKAESAKTTLHLDAVKAMRAAKAVLTPEQIEKWRAGMRDRHRHGRPGGEYGKERASDDPPTGMDKG